LKHQRIKETVVAYVIAEPCVDLKDKTCLDECPVDAIYEGERMLYIQPDECIDCNACEMVCPVEAIYYMADLPEKWKHYVQINADFFDILGSPGGASTVGMTANDPPGVMELEPAGNLKRHTRRDTINEILRGER
jgi:Fe-S-cluster-containing hydrogenase component 2